ncbi:MAG: hypothetical protein ACK55I_39330, partial [bacterium]
RVFTKKAAIPKDRRSWETINRLLPQAVEGRGRGRGDGHRVVGHAAHRAPAGIREGSLGLEDVGLGGRPRQGDRTVRVAVEPDHGPGRGRGRRTDEHRQAFRA